MKEFKGTPGPWYVHDNGVFYDIQTHSGINIGNICASQHTFDDSAHNGLVATANGHLIAAAPELLSALQGVIRVADRETDEFIAARAAVAKALGESQ
ncbi:hypothetical protein [Erwinia aphidicola]|uniref:hypothetical protein n=1 Tax=Erwinia aphidicola TaxID=68334 RepID=UPI0030184AEE